MKLFFLKIAAILIPVICFFAYPIFIEYKTGEFLPIERVINKQLTEEHEVIYGPAYSDQSLFYKIEMAKNIQPDVLAIGNSKILTMRREFFKDNVVFYNAGGTAGNIVGFKRFLLLSSTKPKVIFMTVEPLHFDPLLDVDIMKGREVAPQPYLTRIGTTISQSFVKVYSDYLSQKFTLDDLSKKGFPELIGLNAISTGSGLRKDGSYHYGEQYEDLSVRDEKISRAVTFIKTKNSVAPKEFFSEAALKELDLFLQYCKSNNIYVVGYIPPTPKLIEQAYRSDAQYSYMFATYDKTLPLFNKYNFALYDFFTLSTLGGTEEETIDEYHTSEKVMLRTLLAISKQNREIKNLVNVPNLERMLKAKDQNDVTQ